MIIRLIAIGNKMPGWVVSGFEEYQKRFTQEFELELIEIPAIKRLKNPPTERIIEEEGEKLLEATKKSHHLMVLDVKGASWTTPQLATKLKRWQDDGRHVDMLIGGPDGLSNRCLQLAETKWSLSPLTLPHPLVRIVVAEQLYRAMSILQNHPYHRA